MKWLFYNMLNSQGVAIYIVVTDNLISKIDKMMNLELASYVDYQQQDMQGFYVSPGWIDIHTHCDETNDLYGDWPDKIGVEQGVTTIIDAGSTGANNVEQFYHATRTAQTEVLALLNIAKIGIPFQGELQDLANIDLLQAQVIIQKLPSFIVGLKARISVSTVGLNGIEPLLEGKKLQSATNLPLMVHIGNGPPDIKLILDQLGHRCILTHAFHGKKNNIFRNDASVLSHLDQALTRGLLLDIGHGSASFDVNVWQQAWALGYEPSFISSDIYRKNRLSGPVYSLAHVMSKVYQNSNLSWQAIIDKVTLHPAKFFNLPTIGCLLPDFKANLTFFTVDQQQKQIKPQMAFINNNLITTMNGVKTDE